MANFAWQVGFERDGKRFLGPRFTSRMKAERFLIAQGYSDIFDDLKQSFKASRSCEMLTSNGIQTFHFTEEELKTKAFCERVVHDSVNWAMPDFCVRKTLGDGSKRPRTYKQLKEEKELYFG